MTTAPDDSTRLPHEQITHSEMFDDLGGFDEIAIAKRFGSSINEMSKANPTQFVRALVFVDLRRAGSTDGEAYKAAQAMRLGEVKTYFKAEPKPDTKTGDDDAEDGPGND